MVSCASDDKEATAMGNWEIPAAVAAGASMSGRLAMYAAWSFLTLERPSFTSNPRGLGLNRLTSGS